MKRLFSLLFACVVTLSLSADPVSKESARKIAERFLQQKGIQVGSEAARARGGKTAAGKQSLYVFNTEGDCGFVIVSGDDRAESILGYTTRGSFEEATLPENFRAWLEQMSAEIEALAKQPQQSVTYAAEMVSLPRQVAIHPAVSPLIITEWNQGNYDNKEDTNTDGVYNVHLPMIDGRYPCTGCVATAGAQVMYYYQWPQAPTQVVPGYTLDNSGGAKTSDDLPAITFHWDKMKTKYSVNDSDGDAVNAVADLMLYCGYAAQMNYGVDASGSSDRVLADGMCKYFDYNPDTWKSVSRSDYSIKEWDELVYNELANGRPIIYNGSFYGGHSFICDGYDGAGMYHFNWGWGGSYNGYFKLQATNPTGSKDISDMGYIAHNSCIIGLQPNSWPAFVLEDADDTWDKIEVEGFVPQLYEYDIDGSNLKVKLWNNSENDLGLGFGLAELLPDNSLRIVDISYESQEDNVLRSGYIRSFSFDVSSYGFSNGIYKLVIINKLKGETTWKICRPTDAFFEVKVSGGTYTIVAHPIDDLTVNEFELASGGTPGVAQGIRLSITNNGDNMEKDLYVFLGSESEKGNYVAYKTIRIAKGNTKEYRLSMNKQNPGTYVLRLASDYGATNVLAQRTITIDQNLLATAIDVMGGGGLSKYYKGSTLKVDATIQNLAGDYAQPLYLFGSTTETPYFFYAAGSAIEQGGSEVVTFYFRPNQIGTWKLWIATDQSCSNVIGETTVEVVEPSAANLSISPSIKNSTNEVVKSSNAIVELNVTNNGISTYENLVGLYLYKELNDDSGYGVQVGVIEKGVSLEPSETKTVELVLEDLEDGASYFYYTHYYSVTSRMRSTYSYSFKVDLSSAPGESVSGDADGNNIVDANDVKALIDYMNGVGTINMEAADMDGDNMITIADIIKLVNLILSE